jgi:hypothetical protein
MASNPSRSSLCLFAQGLPGRASLAEEIAGAEDRHHNFLAMPGVNTATQPSEDGMPSRSASAKTKGAPGREPKDDRRGGRNAPDPVSYAHHVFMGVPASSTPRKSSMSFDLYGMLQSADCGLCPKRVA